MKDFDYPIEDADGNVTMTDIYPPIPKLTKAGFDPNQARNPDGTWGSGGAVTLEDRPCFKEWFGNSKVVDKNGKPKTMYHGSSSKINEFNYQFTDKGNDQYGSGFYFTNNESTARGYGENVHPVYLSVEHPLNYIDERKLTKNEIRNILRNAPNLEDVLWNYGDISFLGRNKVFETAVDSYFNYQSTYTLQTLNKLSSDFFDGEIEAFNKSIFSVLGFDGVDVGFKDIKEQFIVAWFPKQIKSVDAESFCHESNINKSK